MPNLRLFLARFWLCDNQMTIILKVYIISYNRKRSIGGTLVDLPIFLDN